VNLRTTYMGLTLKNPLIVGSSPVSHRLDDLRRAADAGAAAVVLFSLFEEQVVKADHPYFPSPDDYAVTPDDYFEHLRRAVEVVGIPILGSLNGTTAQGWEAYARQIEKAGAAGLELNIYHIAGDPQETGAAVEQRHLEILRAVKSAVKIPVALKLSPWFSSLANMAAQFDQADADALVLFNPFYQPDIDPEALELNATPLLDRPVDHRLPLRWTAMLHGRLSASLCATGGVRTGTDLVKYLLAGADAVQTASALLLNGPGFTSELLRQLEEWMQSKEYESVDQIRGLLSQRATPHGNEFERANYIKVLESLRPPQ
jgi:dihydroorotate dehydrogenase (fumarate)